MRTSSYRLLGNLACAVILALAVVPRFFASEKGTYQVAGFVGANESQAAPKTVVKLLSSETGQVLDAVTTNFFGKYKFNKVKPGLFVLQVGEFKHEILVKDKNVRLDFDLSAKNGLARGAMEKLAAGLNEMAASQSSAGATGEAGPPGPNDSGLMQSMAGHLWGYSGSTEVNLMLCPDGTFADQKESSYSGRTSDGLGNQTGAWGAASQRGAQGKWSIQGDMTRGTLHLSYSGGKTAAVPYRAVDNGCWNFDGRTLCRKGPPACK